jgi:hypothetical protein
MMIEEIHSQTQSSNMHPTASKMTNGSRKLSRVQSIERQARHATNYRQQFGQLQSNYENLEHVDMHATPISNFSRKIEERGLSSDKVFQKANQTATGSNGIVQKGNPSLSTAYSIMTTSSKNNNSALPKTYIN